MLVQRVLLGTYHASLDVYWNSKTDHSRTTPLLLAAKHGHLGLFGVVKVLLDHGADPAAKNSSGTGTLTTLITLCSILY